MSLAFGEWGPQQQRRVVKMKLVCGFDKTRKAQKQNLIKIKKKKR